MEAFHHCLNRKRHHTTSKVTHRCYGAWQRASVYAWLSFCALICTHKIYVQFSKFCTIIYLCLNRTTSLFVQTRYPSLLPVMTLALVLVTSPLLATISVTGLVFYLLAVFSVTFLCPTWLFRLQHLKK